MAQMTILEMIINGLLALVGGGSIGGLGAWYLRWRNERHQQYLEQQNFWLKHTQSEFQRMQEVINLLQKEMDSLVKEAVQRANLSVRARLDNEALLARLNMLIVENAQLRAGYGPLGLAEQWPLALIVADETGRIIQATPSVAVLLHWYDHDLIGMNLELLIPPRYQAAHRAGWERLLKTGIVPDYRKIYTTEALTRDGAEVPLEIQLTAWRSQLTNRPGWLVGAVLRRRYEPTLPPDSSTSLPVHEPAFGSKPD